MQAVKIDNEKLVLDALWAASNLASEKSAVHYLLNHDFLGAVLHIALSTQYNLTTRMEAQRTIVNCLETGDDFELKHLVIDKPEIIDALVLGLKIYK
jgi:hypothetical protein